MSSGKRGEGIVFGRSALVADDLAAGRLPKSPTFISIALMQFHRDEENDCRALLEAMPPT
jgi:hypothetical protein